MSSCLHSTCVTCVFDLVTKGAKSYDSIQSNSLIAVCCYNQCLKKITTKTHKDSKNEQTDHLFLLNMKAAKPACIYSEQD